MKNLIIITIIISICGCAKSKDSNKQPTTTLLSAETSQSNPPSKNENNYIINDRIVEILLGFPAVGENINVVKLNSFNLEKTPKINTHDPNVTDTVYTYQNNSGYLYIYKATDRYIVSDFKMQNNYVFKNKLEIGSTKLEFSKIMKLEIPKNDTIAIGDVEQNSSVEFIFNSNKLTQVTFEGYVD